MCMYMIRMFMLVRVCVCMSMGAGSCVYVFMYVYPVDDEFLVGLPLDIVVDGPLEHAKPLTTNKTLMLCFV